MAGRRTKPEVNRHRWHSGRVAAARTPKSALWAYCEWLVSETWHAGPDELRRTTDLVHARIEELIKARREGAR